MMNWPDTLLTAWADNAPLLLLLAFMMLAASGYPVAFCLGALSLFFGWAGFHTGLIDLADFAAIPDQIFSSILFDPALLCLPLLLFFIELLVETGQMERASFAIKTIFDPYRSRRQESKKQRGSILVKSRSASQDVCGERSVFMAIFLPGAIVSIFVARLFGLPPEYLSVALFVPASVLFLLYMINWVLELWVLAHQRQTKYFADWSHKRVLPLVKRQWGLFFAHMIPPVLLVVLALTLVVVFEILLFVTLAISSLVLCGFALLQGKLKPSRFLSVANRAAVATASLGAMLLAAHCFHFVFIELGGGAMGKQLADLMISPDSLPWLPLFLLLAGVSLLGLFLDWIILTLVFLPMLMPVFSNMNFNSLLIPLWTSTSNQPAPTVAVNTAQAPGLALQSQLWLATLVWLSLITGLVTYSRQSCEIVAKTLVFKEGKAQNVAVSMGLFLLLQMLGLTAAIIAPQVVLWLPSLIIG